MTPSAAGLLGFILGALLTALVWWLSRRSASPAPTQLAADQETVAARPPVPEGVEDVLSVLRSGGVVLDREGRVQTASANALAYGLVRRDRLHQVLEDAARAAGVEVRRGAEVASIEDHGDGVRVGLADGTTVDADVLLGADGVHSAVRRLAFPDAPRPAYTGILNAGAWTHYSLALWDACAQLTAPLVEVHISDPKQRPEEFRHHSYVSAVADGVIAGLGVQGYVLALGWLANQGVR